METQEILDGIQEQVKRLNALPHSTGTFTSNRQAGGTW